MTKRTRFIILLACILCFLALAPMLVYYSMGYRFDFKKLEVTETGGIYIRTFPPADEVIIDSQIKEKPGLFSNSVFVQSLLPNMHTVLIEKAGYDNYTKTLPVQQQEVTKLEDVLLFKKNISFTAVTGQTTSPFNVQSLFVIKNYNLYYSSNPANSTLSAAVKSAPVIKAVAAFLTDGTSLIWLGTDGYLYQSDTTNLAAKPIQLTQSQEKISKKDSYTLTGNSHELFLENGQEIFFFDPASKMLVQLFAGKTVALSPDTKNIIYCDAHNVYLLPAPSSVPPPAPTPSTAPQTITLYTSSDAIGSCVWLNNSYVIFSSGNAVTISEIDSRSNINAVILPATIAVSPTTNISISNPQISFDQQSGKLYILTGKTLLSSEKITP